MNGINAQVYELYLLLKFLFVIYLLLEYNELSN